MGAALIEARTRMKTALLIIDVQHALCTGDEAAFAVDRVIENIDALLAQARAAAAPVIFVQHEEAEGSLQFASAGWQLAAGLAALPDDLWVRKTTPDSFHRTELLGLLRQQGIASLIVCGLQSDFCVDSTVRRALALGYPVTLVADAHSTVGNGVLTARADQRPSQRHAREYVELRTARDGGAGQPGTLRGLKRSLRLGGPDQPRNASFMPISVSGAAIRVRASISAISTIHGPKSSPPATSRPRSGFSTGATMASARRSAG